MNLFKLVASAAGAIHLIFSLFALALGTAVLLMNKGTRAHKRVGYLYVIAMLGVNATALMIYRLFGGFGLFHWMAVLSLLTIICGILPMWLQKPRSYVSLHFNFMYWSVIGLYGAFVSETFVRIPEVVIESGLPNAMFFRMMGIGVAMVMGLGAYGAIRNQKKWARFDPSSLETAAQPTASEPVPES